MILFKSEHASMIINGTKTQTRRLGKKRWNVGAIHQCQTKLFDNHSVFAKVRILDVYSERLMDISYADAQSEGGYSVDEYKAVWERINGMWITALFVWVVKFELVKEVNHD